MRDERREGGCGSPGLLTNKTLIPNMLFDTLLGYLIITKQQHFCYCEVKKCFRVYLGR